MAIIFEISALYNFKLWGAEILYMRCLESTLPEML